MNFYRRLEIFARVLRLSPSVDHEAVETSL
jgi:hypothetical protein